MNEGFKGSCKFIAHFPKSHTMIHTRCEHINVYSNVGIQVHWKIWLQIYVAIYAHTMYPTANAIGICYEKYYEKYILIWTEAAKLIWSPPKQLWDSFCLSKASKISAMYCWRGPANPCEHSRVSWVHNQGVPIKRLRIQTAHPLLVASPENRTLPQGRASISLAFSMDPGWQT